MNFDSRYHFNDRESYLKAKREWGKDFQDAIRQVRECKLNLKNISVLLPI